MKKIPYWLCIILLLLSCILLLLWGTADGATAIPVNAWFTGHRFHPILQMRFLRMCGAFVIGASLALSGMTFQGVLRNPLAEPFTLGISGGAGVGTILAYITGLRMAGWMIVPLFSLAGSLLAFGVVLWISKGGRRGPESLLLSGVIIGTITGSILMYLLSIAQLEELASVTWWLLGDLQGILPEMLIPGAILLTVSWGVLRGLAPAINALSLGNSEAWNLGYDPGKILLPLIMIGSLLAAQTVSMAGIIGFCGLIVPHIIRKLFGCDHRKITEIVLLGGGAFLMLCDILSRIIFTEREIPIGVITSLIGGPILLWIINRRQNHVS